MHDKIIKTLMIIKRNKKEGLCSVIKSCASNKQWCVNEQWWF